MVNGRSEMKRVFSGDYSPLKMPLRVNMAEGQGWPGIIIPTLPENPKQLGAGGHDGKGAAENYFSKSPPHTKHLNVCPILKG